MNYQLSVICPSIRTHFLNGLYESIERAFSGSFEFIVISPYPLPPELEARDNVQYIQSWRSPLACQQQGLIASRGEYISWVADDGICLPDSYNIAIESLKDEPYTTLVTGKYQEGARVNDHMETDWYYTLSNHESMVLKGVPKECKMVNCGVVSRSLLIELGGWDASAFQVCPMAYSDFAIRAYRFGCKFILQQGIMFRCSHMPGHTGDHKPIDLAQNEFDYPMFCGIYGTDFYLTRSKIRLNTWETSSEVWKMRF